MIRNRVSCPLSIKKGKYIVEEGPLLSSVNLNTPFYYCVTQTSPIGSICKGEVGVGLIKKVRGVYYFESSIKHSSFEREDGVFVSRKRVELTENLTLSYEPPEKYVDALCLSNAVLCSMGEHMPSPVQLEENSLLGRLDNYIQSIDMGELITMLGPKIVDYLENREELTKIKGAISQSLTLTPGNRPDNPKRGTMIYNLENNRVEVFTGAYWIGLGETP